MSFELELRNIELLCLEFVCYNPFVTLDVIAVELGLPADDKLLSTRLNHIIPARLLMRHDREANRYKANFLGWAAMRRKDLELNIELHVLLQEELQRLGADKVFSVDNKGIQWWRKYKNRFGPSMSNTLELLAPLPDNTGAPVVEMMYWSYIKGHEISDDMHEFSYNLSQQDEI